MNLSRWVLPLSADLLRCAMGVLAEPIVGDLLALGDLPNKMSDPGARDLKDNGMASRKIRVPMADGTVSEGTEVPIAKSSEPWTEIELEDGTILRLKNVVASVIRLDGKFDQEGNPVYVVKAAQAMSLIHVPDELRKKVSSDVS